MLAIKLIAAATIVVKEKIDEAKRKKAIMEEQYNNMTAEEFFVNTGEWD